MNIKKEQNFRKGFEVCVTLWRAFNSLISVRYKALCAEYLAGPKKGGKCLFLG
jgi:hypothetical protein